MKKIFMFLLFFILTISLSATEQKNIYKQNIDFNQFLSEIKQLKIELQPKKKITIEKQIMNKNSMKRLKIVDSNLNREDFIQARFSSAIFYLEKYIKFLKDVLKEQSYISCVSFSSIKIGNKTNLYCLIEKNDFNQKKYRYITFKQKLINSKKNLNILYSLKNKKKIYWLNEISDILSRALQDKNNNIVENAVSNFGQKNYVLCNLSQKKCNGVAIYNADNNGFYIQ